MLLFRSIPKIKLLFKLHIFIITCSTLHSYRISHRLWYCCWIFFWCWWCCGKRRCLGWPKTQWVVWNAIDVFRFSFHCNRWSVVTNFIHFTISWIWAFATNIPNIWSILNPFGNNPIDFHKILNNLISCIPPQWPMLANDIEIVRANFAYGRPRLSSCHYDTTYYCIQFKWMIHFLKYLFSITFFCVLFVFFYSTLWV